jgi:hypothetical protein
MQNQSRASTPWMSETRCRFVTVLLLMVACAVTIPYAANNLWTRSVDFGGHYALVARIMEYGHAPAVVDESLGLWNGYPDLGHRVAAALGGLLGSALVGMQFTASVALTIAWASIGLMFCTLPNRRFWLGNIGVLSLLVLNRLIIHLELYGNELVNNYFFAQIAAQAVALGIVALVLYMERAGVDRRLRYVFCGGAVPIIAQVHPLPAIEVLIILTLDVLADLARPTTARRTELAVLGLGIVAASLALTVSSPSFNVIRTNSTNNGVLDLRYTPTAEFIAVEAVLVLVVGGILFREWAGSRAAGHRRGLLALKYWALLGTSTAALCLVQFLMLRLGLGSDYAVKKYAFGLNTVLLLAIPLAVGRLGVAGASATKHTIGRVTSCVRHAIPVLFVIAGLYAVLPAASARLATIDELLPVERFAMRYRQTEPGSFSGEYDYAVGLFSAHPVVDYMISIGVLKTPQTRNVDDFYAGRLPSNPRRVGRIFTRQGSVPWDVPDCRELATPDGFVILNGSCVLRVVTATAD